MSCQQFDSDENIGPAVQLQIHQDSTNAVFYGAKGECHPGLEIVLQSSSGDVVAWEQSESWQAEMFHAGCSPWECGELVGKDGCEQFCGECDVGAFGRLEPGDFSSSWDGDMLVSMMMTPECGQGVDCDRTCWRRAQAPPGTYTVTMTWYRTCTGVCTCDTTGPDVTDCVIRADSVGDPATFMAQFDYPTETVVDLYIQD